MPAFAVSSEIKKVLVFTAVAVVVVGVVSACFDMTVPAMIGLFCGLEGTALVASALSFKWWVETTSRGFWGKLLWHFSDDAASLASTVSYNPVCFYVGLVLIAVSLIVSFVSQG